MREQGNTNPCHALSFSSFNPVTNPHGLPQQEEKCIIWAGASLQCCWEEHRSLVTTGVSFMLPHHSKPFSDLLHSCVSPLPFPFPSRAKYLILESPRMAELLPGSQGPEFEEPLPRADPRDRHCCHTNMWLVTKWEAWYMQKPCSYTEQTHL